MLGKVTGRKVDCLECLVCLAMIELKDDKLANIPMTNRNCFCSCYVTTQIIFDFTVNKYQSDEYVYITFGVVESYTF